MGGTLGVIFTPLILAVLIAYLLSPLVNYLQGQGLSRSMGIAAIYLFLIALFILLGLGFIPPLLNELQELAAVLPAYTAKYLSFCQEMEADYERFQLPPGIRAALDKNIRALENVTLINLEKLSDYLVAFLSQAFALLLVPLFAFYFLRDHDRIKRRFLEFVPASYQERVESALQEINQTMGAYLRGIFILSFSVGGLLYLGLLLLGLEFALFLGLFNAFTNIIPYFGPLLGALPVILMALLDGPAMVWKAILLVLVVQQVESQLIAPQVLGRNLGFHPLTIILALLLAGKYLGFFGLVFMIPFLAVIRIIWRHFWPLLVQAWREKHRIT